MLRAVAPAEEEVHQSDSGTLWRFSSTVSSGPTGASTPRSQSLSFWERSFAKLRLQMAKLSLAIRVVPKQSLGTRLRSTATGTCHCRMSEEVL